jgi:hypothetical protein
MTAREEAAEAARAKGREKATFEVVGSRLSRNGRSLRPGARIRLQRADADVLVAAGRVKPARGKPADPGEVDPAENLPVAGPSTPTAGGANE